MTAKDFQPTQNMNEETDIQTPTDSPTRLPAPAGSGLARPYCAYCDGYHEDELSCAEKLSTVTPKAERLAVDDLWTAVPKMNRAKVSFAMLAETVKRLNAMGVRIVRECREEGAPEQEAIGGVHVDATRWMRQKINQEDRDIQMSHAIKAANSESQNT